MDAADLYKREERVDQPPMKLSMPGDADSQMVTVEASATLLKRRLEQFPGCTNWTNRVRQQVARFGRSRATGRQRQRVGAGGCVTWRQRRQRRQDP